MTIWRWRVLACLEGMAVMTIELLGAKLLAPYFGATLLTWATVIGTTLASLALGYWMGGKWSARHRFIPLIFTLVGLAVFLMATTLYYAPWMIKLADGVVSWTGYLRHYFGLILSCGLLIGPGLMLLGAVTPMIIQASTSHADQSGRRAGQVFMLSTISSIVTALALGFWIMPCWGLHLPALVVHGGLFLGSAGLLWQELNAKHVWVYGGLYIVLMVYTLFKGHPYEQPNYLYHNTGMLSELAVMDQYNEEADRMERYLLMNGLAQSHITLGKGDSAISGFRYVHLMSGFAASLKPPNSRALLLGFGGGSLALELQRAGFRVDAVELDGRLFQVARDYLFYQAGQTRLITDDGRHFLNYTKEQYDLILMDVFNGDVQPPYLFTQESFAQMQHLLKPGGVVLFNFNGYVTGKHAIIFQSVLNTLEQAGFDHIRYWNDSPNAIDDIVILAGMTPLHLEQMPSARLNPCCRDYFADPAFPSHWSINRAGTFDGAHLLKDDLPLIDRLYLQTLIEYRGGVWRYVP